MKKILLSTIIAFVYVLSAGLFIHASAADFSVDVEKTYRINSPEEIEVTETRKIKNNSSNRVITRENQETFQIIVITESMDKLRPSFLSAKTYIDGNLVQNNEGEASEDSIAVRIPYNSVINVGQTKEFTIIYSNYGLIKKTGALVDIFAPGFAKDYTFDNNNTEYSYKTIIKLRKDLGDVGFVIPTPSSTQTDGDYFTYEIDQESLVGSKIWIQLGKKQYYHFTISQSVKASDSINKGYFNEYKLVIPRDMEEAETRQTVFFKRFEPTPKQVNSDEEGNLIATFKMPSHEDGTIQVEGYAEVSKLAQEATKDNSGALSDVSIQEMVKYLNPAVYWEVDDPEIRSEAQKLKGDKNNIYEITESNYKHIVDTIDYSEVKRFGLNDRQGALKTLKGGAAVCMEYSDLFLTISRAQNIPARAAFGYGYDARIGQNQQDAHQWVQVYLPGLNEWLSVDVTWGESGPTLIGGDLNHFYTHIAATEPNNPPSIQRVSYGRQAPLDAPEFKIEAIEAIPEITTLSTSEKILEQFPPVEKNQLEIVIDNLVLRIQTANIPASIARNAQYIVYAGFGLIIVAGILLLKLLVDIFLKKRPALTL